MTEEEYRAYAEAMGVPYEAARCVAAFAGDDPEAGLDGLLSCYADDRVGVIREFVFDVDAAPDDGAVDDLAIANMYAAATGVEPSVFYVDASLDGETVREDEAIARLYAVATGVA
jgi:hypothetical protein